MLTSNLLARWDKIDEEEGLINEEWRRIDKKNWRRLEKEALIKEMWRKIKIDKEEMREKRRRMDKEVKENRKKDW